MSPQGRQHQDGFSLVEILVAMILLTIALSSLASLSFQVAQRSLDATGDSFAMGAVTDELGYLSTVRYDDLPDEAGCTDVDDDDFPHELCVSITDVSTKMREVTLIITPNVPLMSADTIVVRRSRPLTANPWG